MRGLVVTIAALVLAACSEKSSETQAPPASEAVPPPSAAEPGDSGAAVAAADPSPAGQPELKNGAIYCIQAEARRKLDRALSGDPGVRLVTSSMSSTVDRTLGLSVRQQYWDMLGRDLQNTQVALWDCRYMAPGHFKTITVYNEQTQPIAVYTERDLAKIDLSPF